MRRLGWHLLVGCIFLFYGVVHSHANVAPLAKNDSVRVEQNGRVNIAVLANDVDADGDSLMTRGLLTDAKHSRLVVRNSDGTIHYRPELEFVGQDSFVYLMEDGHGGLAGATVYVTVFPFYSAIDDTVYVKVGTTKSFPVLHNDGYDRETDSLFVTAVTKGDHTDRLVINTDQTLFYAPLDGFLGVDTVAYTSQTRSGRTFGARVFVHNVKPSFAVTDSFWVRQGSRLNFWPLDNDWVVPGDTLRLVSFGEAEQADRLLQNSDGTLHYRPKADFLGFDQFDYVVSDQLGNESTGRVVVGILPLNQTHNDTVLIREGGRINIDVLANDRFFGDTKRQVIAFTQGAQSERVVMNSNGTIHYRSLMGASGEDRFTYEIESGQDNALTTGVVVVKIRALDEIFSLAPDSVRVFSSQSVVLDVLQNDHHADGSPLKVVDVSVDGDAVILHNGLIFFRPTAQIAQVQMTYTVEDTFGTRATEQVFIEQRIEIALGYSVDDRVEVVAGNAAQIDVMANDLGGLRLADVNVARNGQVEVVGGKVRYVPPEGFVGEDEFIYVAADEAGFRVGARVFVTVVEGVPVVDPPPLANRMGDFDGDEAVGFTDFLLFATRFGLNASDANFDGRMDFNADGQIAFADFLQFIGLFGNGG